MSQATNYHCNTAINTEPGRVELGSIGAIAEQVVSMNQVEQAMIVSSEKNRVVVVVEDLLPRIGARKVRCS